MASSSEDEVQKPSRWCGRELDEVFFCVTPRHQFDALYRDGDLDDCRGLAANLWSCLRGRYEGVERRSATAEEAHVWTLKARPRWECREAPKESS